MSLRDHARIEAAKTLGARHPWWTLLGRPGAALVGIGAVVVGIAWSVPKVWRWATSPFRSAGHAVSEAPAASVSLSLGIPWWGWALIVVGMVGLLALVRWLRGPFFLHVR